MGDLSNILGGPWTPPAPVEADPIDVQFKRAMEALGVSAPEQIHFDGKIHRFRANTKGKPGHDKSGWYVAYADGIPSGRFGCWRAGVESSFRADIGRKLTPAEEMAQARRMAEAKAARDAELERERAIASNTVEKIWVPAGGADPAHPYLARKGIGQHGARVTGDGRLIVPLYNADGGLSSLQYIDADGNKLYHSGGQTGGCFWMVGTMDDPGTLYVAEGFATAATIHEATNRPCIVAYSASNLVPVVGTLRDRYGTGQEIVIVADNDASGTGQKYADQASARYGARVIIPPVQGDANDYQQAGNDLKGLLDPSSDNTILKKLKIVFADQLSNEYEAPDELIEGLMTIGSTTVVYGDSNSGKTFFALSIAAAVSTGVTCYGRQVDPGLVVYLACEAPGSIRTRLQAIKKYHGVDLPNIAVVPIPLNFYSGEADAADVISAIKAIEEAKGIPVRLVIADTLARMSAGANENSGEDMGPVMARFEQVCISTGAAMMIIHHNGKDAARGARGWSGIRAHIDTEIEVVEKDGIRSASITKQRELPSKGDSIYFKLEIVEMGLSKFGATSTTCVAIHDPDAAKDAPHKKPSKHDEYARLIERAWFDAGAEIRDGKPYISRSGFKEFLTTKMDYKEVTVRNKLDSSRKDGIILPMINSDTIEVYEHGWRVIDEGKAGAMMLDIKPVT